MISSHHSTRHFPRGFHPRRAILALALAALVLIVILVSHPGPLHAQTVATAPGNLQATVVAGGVQLSWSAPTENAGSVTGYRVLRRASGQSGMMAHVPDTGSSGTSYTDKGAAKQGETYTYQVRAKRRLAASAASNSVAVTIPGTCPISGGSPVDVPVAAVPIVVTSTVEDYFVLYVRHEKGGETIEYPVLVRRGEAGTTTLKDNLAPLPAGRYKVKKYPVNNPADVDGDCIDDLTELADAGTKNPVNPAASVHISNGAVSIADRAAFQKLSYQGERPAPFDRHLVNLEYVKFIIMNPGSDRPAVYFQNTVTHRLHSGFVVALGFPASDSPWIGSLHGEIVYHPNAVAPDGSRGVYRYNFQPWDNFAFDVVALAHEALAAAMPVVENNLAYHPMRAALPRYNWEKALYDASRVNVLLEEDIFPDVDFIPLNEGEGYGLLREMELEERPNSRDIVIYETLPNDLPLVAGIITGVPQTPLSHVNLRAVQNGAPNAFIRAPLDDATIDDLLDRHVYYKVTQSGYTLRAATRAEVDAHYDASRPASAQTPERDLSVTKITPLSEIGFDDWDAFGVKAANMAALGTLGFPEGTVRDGFAVPFYFYDEFMKNAGLAEETVFGKGKGAAEDRFTLPAGTKLNAVVAAILAHPRFRTDYEIQDEMLDDLREAIRDARSPAWIITALEAMHARFPEGTSLRYRSSTNNEDLPGYNGAGLYSSKTQDPGETAEEGIDKSIKAVWASLWNFRAFVERDFHRIDHAGTAMGVLVHPNYSLEKANGVAVSFDPVTNRAGAYYVNTQLGEDLITNPEAHSRPEEILLLPGGRHEVLVRSNLAEPGKLLMSAAQLTQLRSHLEVIHKKFSELYGAAEGVPFAMDIEFKITSLGKLSIKQARPWVFRAHHNRPPTVASAIADATIVSESGTREISLSGVFADDDGDSLTVAATSSDENVATVSVSADYATLTAQAQTRGTATITVAAADGNGGSVEDSFTVRVKAAPVVASAIEDVTGLEVGSTQDISLSGVFSDADGDALTVTAASSDRGVASVSVAADYSGLTVSGVAEGAATITVAAQDSGMPRPTVNQPGAYEGYTLFYHPKDVKFYLIDNQGRKAFEWSQPFGNHGKLLASGNLLTGNGPVHLTERNPRGIPVWSYGRMPNHHDVLKLSNGNYLFLHEVLYQKAEAVAEGANPECLEKNATVKIDEVVEIKPNGEVVWRWRVWDHLIQDHDPDQRNYGVVADHPGKIDINYGLCRFDGTDRGPTHLNALDYNAALNQIMITSRHFSEIWIIDRSTTTAEASGSAGGNGGKGGDLLYRWGNPRAYRQGTKDDQKLFFPHNAHWIPAGLPGAGRVLLYNNGNEHPGFGRGYSSVDEIVLPADGYGYTRSEGSAYGPSGPTWSYRHRDGSLAYWGSGAQRLPNGNTLVVDAPLGRIREVTQSQDVVWEYRSPENRGMYRAYKYAPDHPGVKALPLTPEGDRKPAANLVSDTFLVSVVPPNNPPTVASAIADATIASESGTREISLSGVFADDDGDSLTVTATSSDENVATVSVSADYATLTAQARGTATITVAAADGNGGSVEASFAVTVKAAPMVASAIADVSDLIVGDRRDISLSGVVSDADGDALTVTAASSDENVVTVSVPADQSKLTVTGVAEGAATITVTARDVDGNSVGDAFDVTVAAVVEKQVLAAAPLTFGDAVAPDAVYTAGAPAVRSAGPDAAGGPEPPRLPEASGGVGKVTYSAAGLPAGLSLGPDRMIHGAPRAATASPARVTYSATDEAGESVSLTFQVTVNPAVTFAEAQLSPFTNDIIEYTVGQDADLRFVFPEASGGTGSLTYRLDNREPNVAINDYARGLTFDPITRTLSSGAGEDQPVAGQRYALTYRAEDERRSRAAAYGSIEVNAAPSLPETADRSFTAGSAVSVTLPAATGGSAKIVRLRYSLEPQIPGLSFNSGARELSGAPTATGATVMTYTVMDRNGVTDTTTFTITVAAGAGAPASAPGSVRAAQAAGLKTFGMSWAEVAGASEYVVQVAAEGSGFPTDSAVSSGPAGARVSVHQCCSRAVVDVAEYGNYQARVAAVNAEGAGPWSAATLVAVAEPPPPEPEPVKTYALTPAVRVVEGDYYSLKLTLSDPVPAPYATFRVSIGYGSANAEDVYSGAISTFTLGAGAASWSFSVPTRDDAVDEDDETFTVVVAPTYIKGKWEKAGDGRDTAAVTIADDDTAGITVIAANPLAATEGGTATYTVALDSQPTADVTVTPGSSDGGAVTVAPASHTFTPSDWNRAAAFTVSAVADDDGDDENAVVSHRVGSQDAKYAAVLTPSVTVAVSDTTPPDQQQKAANNPPAVASAIDDATIVNESGTRGAALSGVFSDADGDALTITAASSDESVATVSVAADQSALTVAAKARGTATVTVTASDGNGGSVSDSFAVTVKAAPVVAAAIDDVSEVFIDATHEVDLTDVPSDADEEVLTDVFTDPDGDALTITAESSDTEVLEVATVVDESTETVTGLTVTGVAEGTATVTVTAQDADGNQVSDAFDVTVTEDTSSQFYDGEAAPGPVTDMQLTAEGVSLTVNWSPPAPESGGEVRGYIVHLKPEGGGKGRTKTPKAKKTKLSFDNLEAGQTYKVWVRAQNEAGKGERVHASIILPAE